MNKPKIIFRADAGTQIGYGHFIRTLALAEMLKDDFDCTFVTQIPTEYQKEEVNKVCNLVEMPSDENKFDLFLEMLSGDEIVVLDNYFYTTAYQQRIKAKGCKLVCIDDLHDKHYVADIVINHGIDDPHLFDVESYTRLCLGLDWALLRSPFREVKKTREKKTEQIENVVVCFGGVDNHNLTDQYINYLKTMYPNITNIHAIIGSFYQTTLPVNTLSNVSFYRNVSATEVANLFSASDLAIVSASTICIEALACGTKVAAGWYVENQKEFYEYLVANNFVIGLGNLLDSLSDVTFSKTLQQHDFFDKKENYLDVFYHLSVMNDFYGDGYHFINYINLSQKQQKYVWQVRNSEKVRHFMINSDPFSYEEHQSFVESLLYDYRKIYWAVFKNSEFIASISLNLIHWNEGSAEWGIYLNPIYIGKGYSKKISNFFFRHISQNTSIKCIKAKIKMTNIISIEFHKAVGFNLLDKKEQLYSLEKIF